MIGIVGGSGDFGQGLAERLRRIGEEVASARGPRATTSSRTRRPAAAPRSSSSPSRPAASPDMQRDLRDALAGRIVVSVAAPIVFRDGQAGAAPGELSLAEVTAAAAPEARVVAGFHTVSARALADPDVPLDEDVLLAGDDARRRRSSPGSPRRLVEAGPSTAAGSRSRWLETLTAVLLNVNRRYKTNAGVRVTGLSE